MRDPARIKRILNLIEQIWTIGPDWRLGQLLCNASMHFENVTYNWEDSMLEPELEELLTERTKKLSSSFFPDNFQEEFLNATTYGLIGEPYQS